MVSFKFLLFFTFSLLRSDHDFPVQENCDKIELEITISESPNGNVRVDLVKGDRATVKYIFCTMHDGKVLNEGKFQNNELSGLEKGRYLCIVSTKDCTKKIEFNIE